ncbi:hypothetical protein VFPFJ_08544 [Purpureocillium lilacinum]|uniref:Uncharacterized protein n=1 Tax=Purpureocillium lilacinum TaxID=33203 RepID=A0A179GZT2_PURLI|nr:hypothetical protein VFPFJ_08544 [Purpureocillium lilacinum]OAQ82741.1 hypothetical protein VFPFJ_08544 [Purpureocillium lilacinum]
MEYFPGHSGSGSPPAAMHDTTPLNSNDPPVSRASFRSRRRRTSSVMQCLIAVAQRGHRELGTRRTVELAVSVGQDSLSGHHHRSFKARGDMPEPELAASCARRLLDQRMRRTYCTPSRAMRVPSPS